MLAQTVASEASGIFVTAGVIIGALSYVLWSFVRRVLSKDWSGVINMVGVWFVGIIATVLACSADIVNQYQVNGHTLSDLNGGSRIVIGLIFTSVFGMVPYDFFMKAVDSSRTSAVPNPFARLSSPTPVTPSEPAVGTD